MSKALLPWALAIALGAISATPAYAGPDPAKLKNAAESFEAGARAFKADKFEEAAAHFEAADSAVPSAKSLRLAIRARSEAKQPGRAATLAALAKELYPNDAEAMKIADDVLQKQASKLLKISVSCATPCLLAAGAHIVHGESSAKWTVYAEPGTTSIGASFANNVTAPEQTVDATAGGASEMRFAPAAGPVVSTPPEGDKPKPKLPDPVVEPPQDEPKDVAEESSGISPGFFIAGLIATAGLGGVTIWSGIDTQNNPGPDKVREACKGQGEDCELYQEGLGKEVRTNALIGATAGAAAITLIFAIVTDYGGGEDPAKPEAEARAPRLRVDVLSGREATVTGTPRDSAEDVPNGVALSLTGTF